MYIFLLFSFVLVQSDLNYRELDYTEVAIIGN